MAFLTVKAGPASLTLTRNLRYEIGSAKLLSSGDAQTTNFRGRPYIRGTVEIEDEADALAVLTAAAADATITLTHSSGTDKSFKIKGFQAFDLKAEVGDGQKDGPVVGHVIGFEGNLATADTAATAAVIT
jgi:hypothetical protein